MSTTKATESMRIENALKAVWPDETDIAGASNTHDISEGVAAGDAQFSKAKGGADFEALEIIQFLVQAATLVKVCIEIAKLLDGARNAPESKKTEIATRVEADARVRNLDGKVMQALRKVIDALDPSGQ